METSTLDALAEKTFRKNVTVLKGISRMAGESSTVVNNCVYGLQLRPRRGLLRTPLPLSTNAPAGGADVCTGPQRPLRNRWAPQEKPPPCSCSSFFSSCVAFSASKFQVSVGWLCLVALTVTCLAAQLQRCLGNETADIVSSCSGRAHALWRHRTWESP